MRILNTVIWVAFSCSSVGQGLIDPGATRETQSLYASLKRISQEGFIFGHQDDESYGVGWIAVEGRSDVKDVCGAYPGVHGWDISGLGGPVNIDSVRFDNMLRWIRQVYARGGVNTISWHVANPVSGKNAWDKTPAVKDILPGGSRHEFFVGQLSLVADFLAQCEAENGTKIPIVFRPYHEHNGDWFWWGKGNCTEAEYVALWRWTIAYLRDERKLHHVIYAFSPDRSRMDISKAKDSYLYAYPGDNFVDILGFDDYMDVGDRVPPSEEQKRQNMVTAITAISQLATDRKKVAAMTETGLEGVTRSDWYTKVLLDPIKNSRGIHLAWVLVWRNANTKHHYAPYPGHPSAPDFKLFYEDRATWFENDLKDIYK